MYKEIENLPFTNPFIGQSDYELAKTFPEALSAIERNIEIKKEKLNDFLRTRSELYNLCGEELEQKSTANPYLSMIRNIVEQRPIDILTKQIESLERIKYLITTGDKVVDSGDSIEKAKQRPITDFIKIERGVAYCLWHNEKTPSMHYYKDKNRIHCFGCGKDEDVIGVVQKVFDVGFLKAVSIINK